MTTAQIELPPKIVANFAQETRHRVFKGGRGSGKTRSLALMSAVKVYQLAEAQREGVWLCSREHLNSLADSSLEELKAAIRSVDWLNAYFEIGENYIRTKNRRISFVFAGLRMNLDSIKSKSRILGNWTDEAESVSEAAWRKLVPTIRAEGSENWVSYNPESADSATHKRFIENPPTRCVTTTINHQDNPFFTAELEEERLDDQRLRPETYGHVWEGEFLTITESQIFKDKFVVEDFEPQDYWNGPYQGVDFGFSQDPTVAVRVWEWDNVLYVEYEAGSKALEINRMGPFFDDNIPGFELYTTRADSARPELVSYLQKHGFEKVVSVKKWPGSVEDGVAFIRAYEKVVIHSRCSSTAREFRVYSYKVDRNSGDVLPIIVDLNNHYIDAIRYALAPIIKKQAAPRITAL